MVVSYPKAYHAHGVKRGQAIVTGHGHFMKLIWEYWVSVNNSLYKAMDVFADYHWSSDMREGVFLCVYLNVIHI